MIIKTFILIAFLASAVFAVPAKWQRESCASECIESENFFYEIGRIYEYKYEAETLTSLQGKPGIDEAQTKVTAKVFIQPVTPCEHVLTLKDVSLEGSPDSDEFSKEITRNTLRFSFQNGKVETVCGSEGEPVWVLNFKRGVLSALQNSMGNLEGHTVIKESDVLGECETSYSAKSDGSTLVVEKTKYPSKCSKNVYGTLSKLNTLGYATETLLQGLSIINSEQVCSQRISDEIIKSVTCTETHILKPFSKGRSAQTKVFLKIDLVSVKSSLPPITGAVGIRTDLSYEATETESHSQILENADEILKQLELQSAAGITKEVPGLFSELVMALRSLDKFEIQKLYDDNDEITKRFLVDALLLGRTPATTSMIVSLIKEDKISKMDQSAWMTSLAFIKHPSLEMFSAIQPILETQDGIKVLLGMSTLIHNYCLKDVNCISKVEIEKIIRNMESYIGVGCRSTSEEEKENILIALKALGNIGRFVNAESNLRRCYTEENPMEIRVAAIEAWRRTPCSYHRDHLLQTFSDRSQDNEIRISAYLAVMRCPSKEIIDVAKDSLTSEGITHVSSFVWSHLTNLAESAFPEKKLVGELIREEMLQKKFSEEALKLSRNYESSFFLTEDNFGGMAEANVIFGSNSFLPRSTMFNVSIDMFGETVNLFEIGGRIEGFEKYMEKFFGPDGYYPEATIEAILKNLQQQHSADNALDTYMTPNDDPHGSYYLKIFGNELLYKHFQGISDIFPSFDIKNPMPMIMELLTKGEVDYLKNFNIMDTEFSFPTIAGLPVNLKLSGVASLGFKLNGHFDFQSFKTIDIQGSIQPSAAVKFDASMVVDAFVTKSGIKMISTMHTSTLIDGSIDVQDGKLVDITVNVPKDKTEIFDIYHELIKIENGVETDTRLNPQFEPTRYVQFLGMSMTYGEVVDMTTLETMGRRMYIEKVDSHSSYKFHIKNDPTEKSISFDMPGSMIDRKWLLSLKLDLNSLEIDFHTPYVAADADLTYSLSPSEAKVKGSIGINNIQKYSAELALSSERDREASLMELKILLADSQKELINISLQSKVTREYNDILLKVASTGAYVPFFSFKFDAKLQPKSSEVSLEMKSNPVDVSLMGSITPIGDTNSIKMNGKCRLFEKEPRTITVLSNYKLGEKQDVGYFSGDLNVKEIDFEINWDTKLSDSMFDSKISGTYANTIFNIDQSFIHDSNGDSKEMTLKSVVNIPALNIDVMSKKSLKYTTGKEMTYENTFRYGDNIGANTVARWTYNKDIHLSQVLKIGKYDSDFKFEGFKLSPSSYKIEAVHTLNSQTNQGVLTWNKSAERFFSKLDASWQRQAIPYEIKWDMNADRSELNMEGSFSRDSKMGTIFAKATPKSLSISNTFYKPLSVDATMEMESSDKKFLITASSEEATFRIAATFTPEALKGEIKFGETDVGLTALYQPQNIEMEVWWSPTDKISAHGSYEFEQNGNIMVSVETPFKGWEKQDATLTYKGGEKVKQGQLSITWANSHYFTITSELNTDFQKSDISGSFRITSTLPAVDRIQLSAKLNYFKKIDFEIEGIMNEKEMKGGLKAYPSDNAYKVTAKFTSSFTKDFSAMFSHVLSLKDISTTLQITYGSQETKLSLKGNAINKSNMTLSFICQSPFLPEIMLSAVLEANSSSKIIELKGKFNKDKFMVLGTCEHVESFKGLICKYDLRIDSTSKNIISTSFVFEKNEESEFKSEFSLNSEWLPELGIKGHIEGKVSSFLSVVMNGYISGPKVTGRFNIINKLIDGSLESEFDLSLNSFSFRITADGNVDVQRKEVSLKSRIESSCPVLNDYQIIFSHKLSDGARKTILTVSKGSSVHKIEHFIQILNSLNWTNRLVYNDMHGIDSIMTSAKGIWKHESKITCREKTIEASAQIKIDNKIQIECLFSSPWTSDLKLTAMHKSTGISKQSKIKFEYGNGKTVEIDSDYSFEKYNKYFNLSITNKDWSFSPIKAETKISTLDKKSFELFLTANNMPSLLLKASKYSDTKEMKLEVMGNKKYSVELEIQGDLKEGQIQTKVYLPVMQAPLKADIAYKIENIQATDISVKTSFENSPGSYELRLKLREENIESTFKGPNKEGSLLVTWKYEEIADKAAISVKFISPCSLVSDASMDITIYKDLDTLYKTVTVKYGTQEYNITLKHSPCIFRYIEWSISTPIQGWEAINFMWNFENAKITGEFSRNTRIYKIFGHANANFQRGEADLSVTTPIAGYESNKIYLQHSFMEKKANLFFTTEVGSSKIVVEYNANIIDVTNGEMSFSLVSPIEGMEKLSLKIALQDKMLKVTGIYNKYNFEWTLKTFYEGKAKAKFSLNLISNIPDWTSFEITGDLKCSQSPYYAALTIVKESLTTTYSISANYDIENFSLEIISPITGFEKINLNGKFYRENGYFKTYFSCSNNIYEISFSGYVSLNGEIPDIKMKLLTPFEGREHLEFALNGFISSDKSFTVSVTIGKKQYLVSLFIKSDVLSGKIAADIRLPVAGFENFAFSSLYSFVENAKAVKVNFIWNESKFILASKMSIMELDLDIESSIKELKSFHINCQHKKTSNGYMGFGKISKNGVDYKFEGEAVMDDKEFTLEIKIPSEKYSSFTIKGAFIDKGITFSVMEGTDSLKSYDFLINYDLTSSSVFINIATPFEFFSFGEIQYKATGSSVEGHVTLMKYMETFQLSGEIEISPKKSNFEVNIDIPTAQRAFQIFYDIKSEKKVLKAYCKTDRNIHSYDLQVYLAPTTFSNGFIKFSSTYPGYEEMGLQYSFKWAKLNDVDTFVAFYKNMDKTAFGVKTAFENDKIICKFVTPFEGYKMIGFEAVKDNETYQRTVKLMLGDTQISLQYSFSFGNYFFTIETPFESFKIFDVAAKYVWVKNNKLGLLKFVFNDIKYEISSEINLSWLSPLIKFKFETPIKAIPTINFISTFNTEEPKKDFEFGIQFGDWIYWIRGKLEIKDRSVFVNLDTKSSIEGWKFATFETVVDLNAADKLIRISLEKEGVTKVISLSGKLTDDEMKLKIENPFEFIPNLETSGSRSRSKRSVGSMMMTDHHFLHLPAIWESFHSFTVKLSTPFEKAKEVNFEVSKAKGAFKLNYKRNENFINFELDSAKKKGLTLTVKSALPGWELLAVTGRLSKEDLKAYVSGQKSEKQMEITGSGTFTDKSGSMQITLTTPYEKFKTVNIDLDYNSRRNIVTFKATSDSSDFNILLEFKKGLTIEVFIPHPQQNTVAKGKLTLFNGEFTASSRFPIFKTLSLKYNLTLGAVVTGKFEYMRNNIKVFELDLESNSSENKLHLEIHGRLFGNHSMLHVHRDGWKKLDIIFHRNDEEFKVSLTGSGNLPTAGTVKFTIDNQFREIPKHIEGSLEVDRKSSPKKLTLKLELPRGFYAAYLTYNADLRNLKKGDFTLNLQTPTKDMPPWKKISGNWNIDDNKILTATINVGPMQYQLSGKVGLKETSLLIKSNDSEGTKYFAEWKIDRQKGLRDYYVKVGKHDRYVMLKLHGTFDTIYNADIIGAFRISRFMKEDFVFADKWSTDSGKLTGSGTFEFGTYKGTTQYTFSENTAERAAKTTWTAQSNIPKLNNVNFSFEYNIKRRMIDILAKWDTDKFAVKTTLDNYSKLSSSNVIYVHLPKFGGGEITLSHDFTNPLSKSIKAVGKIGGKNISYIASWTRNAELTVFDLNGNIDSAIIGKASLHIDFDFTDLKDAKLNLQYKRNQDKFVTIKWLRKKSATHLENEMTFKSHFLILPTARFHATADWSKGFKFQGKLEWRNKSIAVNVDFTQNKATASVTTPFEKFGDINIDLDYSFKPKENVINFKYTRGDKVVDFSSTMEIASKKAGSIKMNLTTPFQVIRKITVDGTWKKGVLTATYKRNDDVQVDFEGTVDVKLEKSSLDIKFNTPNRGMVVLKFSYDLDKFIEGTGKKSSKLIDLNLEISGETITFTADGYRNEGKVYIEVQGKTSLDKLRMFYLKLDSELNITKRTGFFEVNVNDFHLKVKNEFEKRKNGFYARSQMESTATPLPGLTLGFGREGEAFIATIGYGDEREISITFKGKEGFKKGFSGKIDIPRRGITDLQYDVTYGFKSNDKLTGNIKIKLTEGRIIEADLAYNSEGVKARLLSPWTGDHSARVRRSISDDFFMADVGFDDIGFTVEGKSINDLTNKGFRLEGEIFKKKILIDGYLNDDVKGISGKILMKSPFAGFETLSGIFILDKENKEFSAKGNLDSFSKISFDVNVDLNGKIKGNGYFSINDKTYEFLSNLVKAGGSYEGTISLFTPHTMLSKVTANGFFEFSSFPSIRGSFQLQVNDDTYDVNLSHSSRNGLKSLDFSYVTSEMKEVKLKVSYSLVQKPIVIKIDLSRSVKEEQTYSILLSLITNSIRDLKGDLKINLAKYLSNISGSILATENSVTGDISANFSDKHVMLFKIDVPSSSTREIIFEVNSPSITKSTLKIRKYFNEPIITIEGSSLTSKGTYKIVVNYDNTLFQSNTRGTGVLEVEVVEPEVTKRHFVSLKVTRDKLNLVADLNIHCGTSVHIFQFRTEINDENMTFEASANTPILYYGLAKISLSLNMEDDIQVLIKAFFNEKLHKALFRLALPDQSFIGFIESPLLSTGIGKLEASAEGSSIKDTKLHFLISDTKNTISAAIKLKLQQDDDKEIKLKIATPFDGMKKMNFGIEYSNQEIKRLAIVASPLALKAECFFGISESIFSAGVEIKTPIEFWELTEAKAVIPLNTFAPNLKATVYGVQYGLESKINESETGGELMIKGFKDTDISEMFVRVRTQVPYEVQIKTLFPCLKSKQVNFGIIFDSSILSLYQEMLI